MCFAKSPKKPEAPAPAPPPPKEDVVQSPEIGEDYNDTLSLRSSRKGKSTLKNKLSSAASGGR